MKRAKGAKLELSTVPTPLLVVAGAAVVIAGLSFFNGGAAMKPPAKAPTGLATIKALAEKWSKLFSVPMPLILMISHIESSFNPNVHNLTPSAMTLGGCWGLMAMGLKTAQDKIAQIKGNAALMANPIVQAALSKWDGTGPSLHNVDLNLMVGTYMLSGLWIKYKGNYRNVAAAYHSGSGTVDKLLAAGKSVDVALGPAGREYIVRADKLWPTYQAYA